MARKLVQVVGGALRLYALLLYFIGILGMTEHILFFLRSFLVTRNFA
jgi:hypothetical protein